ncbi:MAG: recombinase RecA [Clostridiales bacterium]|jgi:recombination protein RecA|nr:recombinase RecA [Clostridiales bacterium]
MASKTAPKKVNAPIEGYNSQEEKLKALSTAIGNIEKAYGKGSVMKLGEKPKMDIPVISTGLLSLDINLGVGGVPKGRIVEIYGPEASGKTTLALQIVAQAQHKGGIAGYIDAEHALDPVYAKNLGVNIDELYISQPDDGEQALDICDAMVRSGAVDIIIVDSVAALVPKSEIEGEMGQSHMGVQARLMSQALRKLAGFINKYNCVVIFINQLREKIGNSYGPTETTTGGRALKFYASVRIDIRKSEYIKSGTEIVGSRTKIKVSKNKVAPPFKECIVDIMYGQGISRLGDLLDLAINNGIAAKGGAWFSYGETRLGQGRDNAKKFLLEHPEMTLEIENKVREIYQMPQITEVPAVGDAAGTVEIKETLPPVDVPENEDDDNVSDAEE